MIKRHPDRAVLPRGQTFARPLKDTDPSSQDHSASGKAGEVQVGWHKVLEAHT